MANMGFTSHCVRYLASFHGALFWGKFALLISRILSVSTFSFSRKYHECRQKLWRFFFLKEGDLLARLLKRDGFGIRESWIKLFWNETKTTQLQADGFWRSLWITFLAKCQKKKKNVRRQVWLFPGPLHSFQLFVVVVGTSAALSPFNFCHFRSNSVCNIACKTISLLLKIYQYIC